MAVRVGDHVTIGKAREILATNLKALRAARGWSQEQLALEAGLHRTFIAHVERCARNISLDNVERLAEALGVEAGQLLITRVAANSSDTCRSVL